MRSLEEWKHEFTSNPFKYALILLVVILAIWFLVIPAYRGIQANAIIEESGLPRKYLNNLSGLYEAQQLCDQELVTTKNQVLSTKQQVADCMNQTAEQQANFNTQVGTMSTQITTLSTQVSTLHSELALANLKNQEHADALNDAARRICCVKRVDDPSINSYNIISRRIECSAGGSLNLTC